MCCNCKPQDVAKCQRSSSPTSRLVIMNGNVLLKSQYIELSHIFLYLFWHGKSFSQQIFRKDMRSSHACCCPSSRRGLQLGKGFTWPSWNIIKRGWKLSSFNHFGQNETVRCMNAKYVKSHGRWCLKEYFECWMDWKSPIHSWTYQGV